MSALSSVVSLLPTIRSAKRMINRYTNRMPPAPHTAEIRLTFSAADSPMKGLTINVPKGAYAKETPFFVSSKPFTGKLPKASTALTPLITVSNGGEYADEIMTEAMRYLDAGSKP